MILKKVHPDDLTLSVTNNPVPVIGAWVPLAPVLIDSPPRTLGSIE
jgi:hypothetical protein